jgi:hypothetical protein
MRYGGGEGRECRIRRTINTEWIKIQISRAAAVRCGLDMYHLVFWSSAPSPFGYTSGRHVSSDFLELSPTRPRPDCQTAR